MTVSTTSIVPSSSTAHLEKEARFYAGVTIGKKHWRWELNPRSTFTNWEADVTIAKRCWRWELNP
jgi:hypothetical protein